MATGLHSPWESALLRNALGKHALRCDPKEGMHNNIKHKHPTKLRESQVHDAHSEEITDRFHHVCGHHRRNPKEESTVTSHRHKQVAIPDSAKKGANAGTLEVLSPRFGGALVKCRISRCINVDHASGPNDLRDFLRMNCLWRQMPLQALGGHAAERAYNGRVPTPRRDVGVAGQRSAKATPMEYTPTATAANSFQGTSGTTSRFTFQGKRREQVMPDFTEEGQLDKEEQEYKELVRDVATWDFMRHLPVKLPQFSSQVRGTRISRTLGQADFHILYSDIKALLEENGEECKADPNQPMSPPLGTPTAIEVINHLPKATRLRWAKILHAGTEQKHDHETLAHLLAAALKKEKNEFKVTRKKAFKKTDAESLVQLVLHSPQVPEGEEVVKFQEDVETKRPAFITDCDSHGGRERRELRFCGIMRILRDLRSITQTTVSEWGFLVEDMRISIIAKAVDRGESQRLRGGIAAAGDRLHCTGIGNYQVKSQPVRERRGKQGLTPDWLLAAIAEASDDEDLEQGDNIRLLSEVTAIGDQDRENQVVTEESWVGICRTLGLLQRRELDVLPPSSDEDEPPSLNYSSTLENQSLTRSLHQAVVGSLCPKPAVESEEARLEAIEDFKLVKTAIFNCVGDFADEACGPIVLEMLLQLASREWPGYEGNEVVPGGAAALVASLLWKHCGWDSPVGRRLIRRLCVAFNSHAHDGILSRAGFIQLATDAGWVTARDKSAKNKRLWQAFSDVVGDDIDEAEFGEFVLLIESVAHARSRHFDSQHGEEEGLIPIPGEARHWPFIERAVLQAAKVDEDPIAPIWLKRSHMQKLDEKQKRHSLHSRCDSHASLSSAGDADSQGHRSRPSSKVSSRRPSMAARNDSRRSRMGSRSTSRAESETSRQPSKTLSSGGSRKSTVEDLQLGDDSRRPSKDSEYGEHRGSLDSSARRPSSPAPIPFENTAESVCPDEREQIRKAVLPMLSRSIVRSPQKRHSMSSNGCSLPQSGNSSIRNSRAQSPDNPDNDMEREPSQPPARKSLVVPASEAISREPSKPLARKSLVVPAAEAASEESPKPLARKSLVVPAPEAMSDAPPKSLAGNSLALPTTEASGADIEPLSQDGSFSPPAGTAMVLADFVAPPSVPTDSAAKSEHAKKEPLSVEEINSAHLKRRRGKLRVN